MLMNRNTANITAKILLLSRYSLKFQIHLKYLPSLSIGTKVELKNNSVAPELLKGIYLFTPFTPP